MVNRPSDVYPSAMLQELRRLAALPGPAALVRAMEYPRFECRFLVNTWLMRLCVNGGADLAGIAAGIAWLKDGPKIARVNEAQYAALSQVEVRLELKDVSMPYPAVMVDMPEGRLHRCVLVHKYSEDIMVCMIVSHDHEHDITTVIRQQSGVFVEESLGKFDDELADEAEESCAALRVAVNMCLAMSNYGHHSEHLFPKEVEQERKYVGKGDRPGRDGRRASDRLREQPVLLTLERTVVLHRSSTDGSVCPGSAPTGREMPSHWRRGHWAMQPHGPGRTLRKPVLRPPVLVRADLLSEPVTTVYRS